MTSRPAFSNHPFQGNRIEVKTTVDFEQVLQQLRDQMGQVSLPEIVGLSEKVRSAEEYTREINTRYVGNSGFILFAEIDHGTWIKKFGVHRRSTRLIFGNPLIAITMIRHDISAGLFAPVELLIIENEGGGGCSLIYIRPSSLMVIDHNPPLLAAAKDLDQKLDMMIAKSVGMR